MTTPSRSDIKKAIELLGGMPERPNPLGFEMGMPVFESPYLPAKKQKIQLSNSVDVSPEFRAKFDARLAELFGYEEASVYITTYGMFGHPAVINGISALTMDITT